MKKTDAQSRRDSCSVVIQPSMFRGVPEKCFRELTPDEERKRKSSRKAQQAREKRHRFTPH